MIIMDTIKFMFDWIVNCISIIFLFPLGLIAFLAIIGILDGNISGVLAMLGALI